jgi:hypothetical protein
VGRALAEKSPEFFAEAMAFELGEFQKMAVENNFELIVLHIPEPETPTPLSPNYQKAIDAHLREPKFHFIDATEKFRRYLSDPAIPRNALCVSTTDCHPGRVAQELLAEELYPAVARLLRAH